MQNSLQGSPVAQPGISVFYNNVPVSRAYGVYLSGIGKKSGKQQENFWCNPDNENGIIKHKWYGLRKIYFKLQDDSSCIIFDFFTIMHLL